MQCMHKYYQVYSYFSTSLIILVVLKSKLVVIIIIIIWVQFLTLVFLNYTILYSLPVIYLNITSTQYAVDISKHLLNDIFPR